MKSQDLTSWKVEDFILDESFQRWTFEETPEALDFWQKFLSDHPTCAPVIQEAQNYLHALKETYPPVSAEVKKNIWEKIQKQKKHVVRLNIIMRVAAMFLMLLVAGSAWFYLGRSSNLQNFIVKVPPSSFTETCIIFADGHRLPVHGRFSEINYRNQGKKIIINRHKAAKQPLPQKRLLNQVIVPFGKQVRIKLPDGTRMWVNAGSKVIYPVPFETKKREIYLEGEAYFEVAHNPRAPFHVRTQQMNLRIIGTKFDVKAYPSDTVSYTVLMEGSLALKSNQNLFAPETILNPNQLAQFASGSEDPELHQVNVEDYIDWKSGHLTFKDDSLEEVIRRIERYYNIQILIDNEIKQLNITGKLELTETPGPILQGLAIITGIEYKQNNEAYELKKPK